MCLFVCQQPKMAFHFRLTLETQKKEKIFPGKFVTESMLRIYTLTTRRVIRRKVSSRLSSRRQSTRAGMKLDIVSPCQENGGKTRKWGGRTSYASPLFSSISGWTSLMSVIILNIRKILVVYRTRSSEHIMISQLRR